MKKIFALLFIAAMYVSSCGTPPHPPAPPAPPAHPAPPVAP